MWQIKQQGVIYKNGCTIENVGGFHWKTKCNLNEGEVVDAIRLYYSEQAFKSLTRLFERKSLEIKEIANRLNKVREISKATAQIVVHVISTNTVYKVELSALENEVTVDQINRWLDKKEEMPYAAYVTLRAAMNKKFMAYCNQRG